MDKMPNAVDYRPGAPMILNGQEVRYVGVSMSGAFLFETAVVRNERGAPVTSIIKAWPFQLTMKEGK